ncbi:hypothetical protein [Streptomyces sp. NPDC048643]|uniref:hypothetical protein n=1 Tax=Streptomyces sp. NPDC048643 TaxID=3155637 RepID=UPI003426815B
MSDAKPNPFLSLSPAAVDVLDDMREEWNDRERHGELNGGWGYGPKKTEALSALNTLITEAWRVRVAYIDVEETSE